MFDYLIVGAGFAGSVLAERLARGSNKKVLIVDRRSHIGGNAYDCFDDHGILVHKYGPHIFHTASKEVFDFLSRFTDWRQYQHKVLASVDGQLVPIPINLDTINRLYGENLTSSQLEDWFARRAEKKEVCRTSEDVVVNKVGRELYEKFFRGYTRKQWGLDPSELDAQVTARVPTRTNRDDRYFTDAYQAMPKHGFTRMFERMLDHPNIKVMLNTDYREVKNFVPYEELIFTGPVDEYFDYRYGRLPYRCLEFKHETVNKEWAQPVAVINYPNDYAYTRVTEFKHLTGQEHAKTSLVYEFSCAEGDPYYPIPRAENAELYRQYAALAEQTPNVHFVGRLATYKYYNMDQVVAQALTTYAKIVGLSRQEAVTLKTDPLDRRIHVPIHAELVPVEGGRNGNGNSNGNGNGNGKGNGHSAVRGNGHGKGSLSLESNESGNGNGHRPKRRGRASATEVLGSNGLVSSSGNGHGHTNGNGNGHTKPTRRSLRMAANNGATDLPSGS